MAGDTMIIKHLTTSVDDDNSSFKKNQTKFQERIFLRKISPLSAFVLS